MYSYPTLKPCRFILLTLAALTLGGCCSTNLRNENLEQVAKDWALVIRASQVIPVYPLSEDLQPGDVLLVSTPIENQVEIYKEKGFLPLDQLLVRLPVEGYQDFYNSRYGITDDIVPPEQWQKQDDQGLHNWKIAPLAAFPTYQFEVETGSGFNLAVPLQGVPFALGLMNSGKANGTVTIADAYTYGLDNSRIQIAVDEWARENRRALSSYGPIDGKLHFLRVVSRVYVASRVNVVIQNEESTDGGATVGPDTTTPSLDTIDRLAEQQLPNAKLKITTASSRSVTMSEEFARPLVIGYVGFDMPIYEGGRLGPPVSSLAQLNQYTSLPTTTQSSVYRLAALRYVSQVLRTSEEPEAIEIRNSLDELAALLPGQYVFTGYEWTSPGEVGPTVEKGTQVDGTGFEAVLDYLGYAQTTEETLTSYLRTAPKDNENQQAAYLRLEQDLNAAQAALKETLAHVSRETALARAIDFALLGV